MNNLSVTERGGKVKVLAPNGKAASPYRIEDGGLVKNVQEKHIFRARQAIGIDEDVYQSNRNAVQIVRFNFWDGRVYEIGRDEFEHRSFLHGDGVVFAPTRFVRIADLHLVREKRRNQHQLSLFSAAGVAT